MITTAYLIERIAGAPALLTDLLASVPPRDLKRRPLPGKWSAHEHACHLALIEPQWTVRLDRILTEECPTIISYEPGDEPEDLLLRMDLGSAMAEFAASRVRFAERLRQLPPTAWDRPAIHTSHARYSIYLMCRHAMLHDGIHAYRIEESALGSLWPQERDGA